MAENKEKSREALAKELMLLAKQTVERFLMGMNRSKAQGQGLEFAQYKSYQQGDDLRNLDWKMYARSGKYFLKEASIPRSACVHLLLDNSASMLHRDSSGRDKLTYGKELLATLAYLSYYQGDQMGFDALATSSLQRGPGAGFAQLNQVLHLLAGTPGENRVKDELGTKQTLYPESTLAILVSDLYQHGEEIQKYIHYLLARKQEVILFHLLAENEMNLSFEATQLQDLETGELLDWDRSASSQEARQRMRQWIENTRNYYLSKGVHYHLLQPHTPVEEALKVFTKQRIQLYN